MHRNRIWPFGNPGERTQRNRILPLSGPGGFRSTAAPLTTTSTRVTWTLPKAPADSYRLERSTDKLNWTTVASGLTVLTADDTGRTESTLYYYRVISVVGGLDKETSEMSETWTVPSTPTGLTATPISNVQINLAWTDVSTGNTAQVVERRSPSGSGTYNVIATVGATATAYNDETTLGNTTYDYRVAATNPAATSAYATATNALSYPSAPVVTIGTVTSNSIALSWTATGATYTVEWSADGGFTWASVGDYTVNTNTSVTHTGLSPSTGYDYRIRATNASGNSGYGFNDATTSAGVGPPAATYEIDFTTDNYIGTKFSRASRGTFVNSSGYIQAAEMNLVLQSNDASTATWSKTGTTVTTNQTTAPDGTNTAQFVNEGGGGLSTHRVSQLLASPTASRGVLTGSVYLKQGLNRTHGFMSLLTRTSGGGFCTYTIVVDLTNGTVTSTNDANSNTVSPSYSVTSVGSGWYRLQVTATTQLVSGNDGMAFGVSNSATPTYNGGYPEYTGTNNNGVYAWGAQIVQGSSALLYVATGASSVGTPRVTYDPVTLTNRGLLLENQATNLCLQSETGAAGTGVSVTADTATSPANTTTADTLTETAGTGFHHGQKPATTTITASTTYTYSGYFKNVSGSRSGCMYMNMTFTPNTSTRYSAVFDLVNGTVGSTSSIGAPNGSARIEAMQNGWYRCSITATSDSTNTTVACYYGGSPSTTPTFGNSYISYTVTAGDEKPILYSWGFQLEAGATPTSYIPTTTAQVTRSGDVFGLVSAELSPFWNQTAGSLIIDNRWLARVSQNAACRVGAAGAASSMMTEIASFSNSQQCVIKNVSLAYSGPNAELALNTNYKVGFAYDNGPNFKGFRNGSAGSNVTSVTIPTVDKMEFGTNQNNNMVATNTAGTGSNYTISRLRYWNTKLSDGDMTTLTAP